MRPQCFVPPDERLGKTLLRVNRKSPMGLNPEFQLRPEGSVPAGRLRFSGPLTPSQSVANWNENVRVGAPVIYWQRDGYTLDTATCSAAKLQGEQAVIWLYGCSLVELDRVLMR